MTNCLKKQYKLVQLKYSYVNDFFHFEKDSWSGKISLNRRSFKNVMYFQQERARRSFESLEYL